MSIFTGAGVALITPMREDGEVNYEKLEELINYQIDNGTDALIICGTTGEASTLTHEEHLDVIKAAVDFTKGRVPVVAGTGSNCTKTAVYLSEEARARGVDGVLVVSPYYNKATQNGLKAHFTAVAKAAQVPVILYNIPGRTGCNIQPETIVDLAKNVENIVAVKEATGDISQAAKLLSMADGNIDVYSGNDDQIVPLLSLGGQGVISVLSHVLPKETHDIVALYKQGKVEESAALQLKYIPLIGALFSEVNPIPVKAAMNLMGFEVGTLRSPLTPMEDAHVEVLREEMIKAGIKVVK